MFEKGWIKIHRRLKKKGYYKNSKFVHLWVHLLMKVNHCEKEFMWNDSIILIKAGQFITGRKQLSEETGISESTIERILKVFENEQQIEQQKTTKYRLITIVNWKEYQDNEQQNGQQINNKRTTDGQQMDTNKNDKNEKNEEGEDTARTIIIKTLGTTKPAYVLYAQELIGQFGKEKARAIFKEFADKEFHSVATMRLALNADGTIKPKPKTGFQQKIDNSTYKHAQFNDPKKDLCECGCGKKWVSRMGDSPIRLWKVASKQCYDRILEDMKPASVGGEVKTINDLANQLGVK